jgi:hypothetical protein
MGFHDVHHRDKTGCRSKGGKKSTKAQTAPGRDQENGTRYGYGTEYDYSPQRAWRLRGSNRGQHYD